MKSLGIAFAGFRHAHIFGLYNLAEKRDDLKIVGAWEDDGTSRKAAEEKGVIFRFKTYEDLLSDPAVDIVAIGDYYAARGELAIAALRAGKHVLADKPLCSSRKEWETIREEREKSGLTVGIMLDLADNANFHAAAEAIREGTLGKINNIAFEGQHPLLYGTRPGWYFEKGKYGGVVNDIAIHGIDFVRTLTGSGVEEVIGARSWNFYAKEVPHFKDSAQFILKMASGAGLIADVSYSAPDTQGYSLPAYWHFRVWGEKGMMEWSYSSDGVTFYPAGENGGRKLSGLPPEKNYLDRFLAAVRTRDDAYSEAMLRATEDTLGIQEKAE
ncbi:MAG: Gfo/Idh/MocA family oxidoreductase [Clostridia bacterium]|nr:Gfo/Idh/MocA family oxidoreductase [Clostridia bacterium]